MSEACDVDPCSDPRLTAVEEQIELLLGRARTLARAGAEAVYPGLHPVGYLLLTELVHRGPTRAGDLAQRVGLDKAGVSRHVARLASLGLAERRPDPTDGRAHLVSATPAARRVWRERVRDVRATTRTRLAEWPAEDVDQLVRLLTRLNGTVAP